MFLVICTGSPVIFASHVKKNTTNSIDQHDPSETINTRLIDSCATKLDSFVAVYYRYVIPSTKKMVTFWDQNQKEKGDSIQMEITRFYDDIKNEITNTCEITRLDYIKRFYTPYLAFNFTGWPQKRAGLFAEMENMLAECEKRQQDSAFYELINRKSNYHLRVNQYSEMKYSLEKGIKRAETNVTKFFHYLFVFRINYSLYFLNMNLPEEALKVSKKNDEMADIHGIHDKALYVRNMNFIADAYTGMNDLENYALQLKSIEKFCTEESLSKLPDCKLDEHYFNLAMKQGNYSVADSILEHSLKAKLDRSSYDTKLRQIKLYTELKRFEEAEKAISDLYNTFEIYRLEGIQQYRLHLMNAQINLVLKSRQEERLKPLLEDLEYIFLANIYNVFNEDPHLQYAILKPMHSTAGTLLGNLRKSQDPDVLKKVFSLNTNLKKLNPVFLGTRNELLSKQTTDDQILRKKSKLQDLSNEFAIMQKSVVKDPDKRKMLMDSIILLEKEIQSALVLDMKFSLPDVTVKKIQDLLMPDQLYLEFFDVRSSDNSANGLFAAVIEKNKIQIIKTPEVNLDPYAKINFTNNKEENKKWYDYFFSTITPELKDKTEVIVISDGIVNQVPLEILSPDGSRKNSLIEKFRFHYYASSKSFIDGLIRSSLDRNENNKVLAIGGIDYDCSDDKDDKMIASVTRTGQEGLQYLPGSLKEVEFIHKLYNSDEQNSVNLLTGCQASKTSLLQNIQEKKYNILHVSTHGVVNKSEFSSNNQFGYLESGNASFLALADGEKGFISAYEITQLDARHVHLVYLSACSSGIGPYISGQGLFSIGDAFAAAGAKKVIHTLWDIPDDFAVSFAGTFYENLKKNNNISKAFNLTREFLSDTFPPVLWASFRLLE